MIKQTLYFSSPTYLSLKNKQLHIHIKEKNHEKRITRPIEDIGVIILDNGQITITHNVVKSLQDNKTAIVSCGENHMPHSLMLPLEGHSEQSKRYNIQLEASLPLKKNLWQQTIEAKIRNQIVVLNRLNKPAKRLEILVNRVQSGDTENTEGQAAAYYWSQYIDGFLRDRYGDPPNNLLNYGYAVLRAMIARALVSSGLNLTLGIHHRNKYNAFCLADDIMEPYRPFVDLIAHKMYTEHGIDHFLSTASKKHLLSIGQKDGLFGKLKRPLMVGMAFTSSSLFQCFSGEKRKIIYPLII